MRVLLQREHYIVATASAPSAPPVDFCIDDIFGDPWNPALVPQNSQSTLCCLAAKAALFDHRLHALTAIVELAWGHRHVMRIILTMQVHILRYLPTQTVAKWLRRHLQVPVLSAELPPPCPSCVVAYELLHEDVIKQYDYLVRHVPLALSICVAATSSVKLGQLCLGSG
eukprot:1461067-Amphidinium_carterae.1